MVISNCGDIQYTISHHVLFKMTGSFFNPGPFAGYLASVFPIIVGGIFFNKKYLSFLGETGNQIILWIGVSFILLTLVAADSRAACLSVVLSSVVLLFNRYSIIQRFKAWTSIKRNVLSVIICFLICACFIGLIRLNDKSANGRLFIWKVSFGLFIQHPLTGVGFDRFKTYYMDKQADYFENRLDSPEAMVAGDTNYCFNEFLQQAVENGLIGLLFMVGVLVCLFGTTSDLFDDDLWIAKAGLVGIMVFAFFSYPAQILPIKMTLVCYLAYIATSAKKQIIWHSMSCKYFLKGIFVVFTMGFVAIGINFLPAYYKSWKSWSLAYDYFQIRNYTMSLNESQKAWPLLKYNGDFVTHHGKILTLAGEYVQAVNCLQQAVYLYPNIIVYTALGDNYKALGQIREAEQAYLKACYMNPSRFYPQYLLVKLYDDTNQNEKAIALAKELLNKEVKIESTAIHEIQTEIKKILDRNIKSEIQCVDH